MCAQIPTVMVVVIISDIVGNEENLNVKITIAHVNLSVNENELEIDPVDNLNNRKGRRSM